MVCAKITPTGMRKERAYGDIFDKDVKHARLRRSIGGTTQFAAASKDGDFRVPNVPLLKLEI